MTMTTKTTTRHTDRVVTYTSPDGCRINLCTTCIAAYESIGRWPKSDRGEEYCEVSQGEHQAGVLHVCARKQAKLQLPTEADWRF